MNITIKTSDRVSLVVDGETICEDKSAAELAEMLAREIAGRKQENATAVKAMQDATDLRNARDQLADQIQRMSVANHEHAAENKRLQGELDAVRTDNGTLNAELETAKAQHKQGALANRAMFDECERLRGELKAANRQIRGAS